MGHACWTYAICTEHVLLLLRNMYANHTEHLWESAYGPYISSHMCWTYGTCTFRFSRAHEKEISHERRYDGKLFPMENVSTFALKSPAYFQKLLVTCKPLIWAKSDRIFGRSDKSLPFHYML